jgi:hypothetical protein
MQFGKSIIWSAGKLLPPATKDAVISSEIPRGLGNAVSLLGDQRHGLQLEFSGLTLSFFL